MILCTLRYKCHRGTRVRHNLFHSPAANNEFVFYNIPIVNTRNILRNNLSDFMCREGYAQVTSVDGQQWCYMIVWPIPPTVGFNFSVSFE